MLNPDLKQNWIAALRSRKFTQTTKRLKDDTGHCCLGVLCEISPDVKFVEVHGEHYAIWIHDTPGYETKRDAEPPPALGLKESEKNRLIRMNDGTDGEDHHTFEQIADYIEKNPNI